jgi:hypothetical protein
MTVRSHLRRRFALAPVLLVAACGQISAEAENAAMAAAGSSFLADAAVAQQPGADAAQAPAPPRAPRDAAPAVIRGIYVNAYVAGSPARLGKLLDLAATTEINTFVVDVKDEDGIRYRSEYPLAMEVTHRKSIPVADLRALVDTLHAHGLHSVARVVVFKDRRLSGTKPEWSILTPDGGLWRDREGVSWVSPWNPEVWEYNIRVAEEAARAGFREVQFDYVRFPEAYRSLPPQVHPHARGERTDAIAGFLAEARRRLHPLGASVSADVFGLSMNEAGDVGIGQQWEEIAGVVDHVLPMVYPSHYFPTHLRGVPRPNRMPYETVQRSVGMGVIRNERLQAAGTARPARIVPWLQAFDAPWVDRTYPYGPEQLRAQTRAVYDLGLEDWILWHPGSRYDQVAAGLEPSDARRARSFVPSDDLVASVDGFETQRARRQAERIASSR